MLKGYKKRLQTDPKFRENMIVVIVIYMFFFGLALGWVLNTQWIGYKCKVALNDWKGTEYYEISLDNFSDEMDQIKPMPSFDLEHINSSVKSDQIESIQPG